MQIHLYLHLKTVVNTIICNLPLIAFAVYLCMSVTIPLLQIKLNHAPSSIATTIQAIDIYYDLPTVNH